MSDQGPTTVGSIVAKLKMDRVDWVKDKDLTKEEAAELGRLSPTITVDTNAAEAIAKLKAVQSAATQAGMSQKNAAAAVAVAQLRQQATTDAAALAMRRLDAAIASGTVSEEKLAVMAEVASRAQTAQARSTTLLTNARAALAAVTKAETAEEVENTAATVKANEANKTSASRIGLIATAVAILVPMMVPLAAFTIGAAGALTMMGVAGVLAIVGIKREMAEGTDAGARFAAGTSALKDDLNELAHTSANAMLGSYLNSVGQINAAMPMLNQNVSVFSGILGRSGTNLIRGTITGLGVLEPLLVSVGVYVEGLTAKFAAWTTSGGLQKFGQYATSVLPLVERFLGQLSTAVMHLLESLATLGSAGLSVFGAVLDAISGIPVDTLTQLIAAVMWGTLAFKAWGFIAPMLAGIATQFGAVGAAATIATGPIGWVVGAVAAIVAVTAVLISTQQQATSVQQDYTAAVQADTGAIGENVKAKVAQALQDDGALAAARKLGIALPLVTSAALGNAAAQKQVGAEMKTVFLQHDALIAAGKKLTPVQEAQFKAAVTLTNSYSTQSASIKTTVAAYNNMQEAQGQATISGWAQVAALQADAKAAGVSVGALLAAKSGQNDTGAATQKTTALMYLQSDAAGLLKQSLDLLNGKTLNAAQAQNQFDSQLANMSTHMDQTGKVINRADTLLTGMTASAVANRGELISLTTAAENNAQAFRDAGGGAEETRQKLISMKQTIIDNAVAHGEDRAQVQQYVDTLFKIPASIPPTKIEVDTAAAMAALDAFKAKYKSLGDTINLTATGGAGLGSGLMKAPGHADGGTVAGPGTSTSDSILTRLSVGEEVIRTASASQARPFLKAFNANPGAALSSVASMGAATASGTVMVSITNKSGASLADLIDMHIESASQSMKVNLSTGTQKVAY